MKKILIFGAVLGFFAGAPAYAAVRDGAALTGAQRNTSTSQSRTGGGTVRADGNAGRAATTQTRVQKTLATRAGSLQIAPRTDAVTRTRTAMVRPARGAATTARATTRSATARAATNATNMSETRTGAAYNQCKSAYFQCMDQFCTLKNDEYRRCSCSARINDMVAMRKNLDDTNAKLSEFTENLDIVGLTAAQATATHTASDGENALTRDVSASKALLNAIMNSIRGEDGTVGGKWSDLDSVNLSFDTTNMFGLGDTAQVVASYNGVELYNAVYQSCRTVVASDCNDASLQRAVTAYLMAIEQDCNTVQTALAGKQRELKTAIREGDAMLDLARIENRKKHNSSDMTTCINEVESAILSEQVCGANYHKCLDNGEFIDVTTGAPITGVVNFNELGKLLKFDFGKDAVDQKLSQTPYNQKFLKSFENKTKKFAMDALDKCVEIADDVWAEYLDKALLDIYYAQQSKVKTIQNGCFDLISACYAERDAAITAAMAALIDGGTDVSLAPDKIVLTQQMCSDYIDSCNGMFGDDVIAKYIESQKNTDTLAACRAVAQQCFDSFGGANYENFYAPNSGLFTPNIVDMTDDNRKTALDWFTLYAYDADGARLPGYKSICAQRVADIASCADKVEDVFGGMDVVVAHRDVGDLGQYEYTAPNGTNVNAYGWARRDSEGSIDWADTNYKFKNRRLRPTGVATEVYNQIIDGLITQCTNVQGKFVEAQFIDHSLYNNQTDLCKVTWPANILAFLNTDYGVLSDGQENVCPKDYELTIDAPAWGICSCWENGGRRSKNGFISKCAPVMALDDNEPNDAPCGGSVAPAGAICSNTSGRTCQPNGIAFDEYCTSTVNPATNQVCPIRHQDTEHPENTDSCQQNIPDNLPMGIIR